MAMAGSVPGARNPRVKTNFTNSVHTASQIKTTLYRLYNTNLEG